MTLDEAIRYALEVAETNDCEECRAEHRQLAEWLEELKMYRAIAAGTPKTFYDCFLIQKAGQASIIEGKCLGFATSSINDEPCHACRNCHLNYFYEE